MYTHKHTQKYTHTHKYIHTQAQTRNLNTAHVHTHAQIQHQHTPAHTSINSNTLMKVITQTYTIETFNCCGKLWCRERVHKVFVQKFHHRYQFELIVIDQGCLKESKIKILI